MDKTKKLSTKKRKKILSTILLYAVLIGLSVIVLIPFIWMVSASLKQNNEVFTIPIKWIPNKLNFKNYVDIWTTVPLLSFFKNTVFLSVTITAIQLLTSSFAAYGFSKVTFKGRDTLFLMYVATIAVPWQVFMIPQFLIVKKMGLVDNLWSLVLMQAFNSFGVFLMRQYYMSIPEELSEAARIDGLSEWGIFRRIILPLTKPALASLTIITFVNTWNDYMGPFIYLNSTANKTIQLGLKMFVSQYDAQFALIMAASVVSIIPIAIIFLLMQKNFVEGISTSGMKG